MLANADSNQTSGCVSHLGFQVNVGQRHLGDLVETQGERDGAQDEKRVVDRHPHQHDDPGVRGGHLHQQGARYIDDQEHQADEEEEQVQRQPVCQGTKADKCRHDLQITVTNIKR